MLLSVKGQSKGEVICLLCLEWVENTVYRYLREKGTTNRICELKISDYIGDAQSTVRANLIISRDSFSWCCVYTEADAVSGEREPHTPSIYAFRAICSGCMWVCGWGPSSPAWSGSCSLLWPHPKVTAPVTHAMSSQTPGLPGLSGL